MEYVDPPPDNDYYKKLEVLSMSCVAETSSMTNLGKFFRYIVGVDDYATTNRVTAL